MSPTNPLSTGVVYCELVCALQGLALYGMAEEWTEAMERWSETNAIGSLHGRCRVHRAEILRLRGRCDEAEEQALLACDELRPFLRRELGCIRFNRGDIVGAEEEARRERPSAMRARSWTGRPRRPTADALRRSRRTSTRRALGDAEREAQADAEREFLVRELSRAFGLGGRARRAGSASERARVGVTRAVRQAMSRIAESHPQLKEHLDRTIRTGTYCAYEPDPRAPAGWNQ